jgi:hypothetical protein
MYLMKRILVKKTLTITMIKILIMSQIMTR